ncbi:glycosyltransferase involved in cell wall biosynthesis [Microcella putealis]|uniref:Glycosyltransferase involved in cell wall biosynthesis n=1 Tax=Microcella putealis TaxID=337005 RepID=A0A4Q7LSB2_9MICO|nr:glycosyltransferase family 2 protein [Microcella putealis]RZS57411.1 glycosyltransferase involved in cell wall biosynthesis [Microcella putealis]TQM19446.1 glycosyltransferase involved in cell wall biosynthesis [Microcella putealis]
MTVAHTGSEARIVVIMPAFNEREAIENVIKEVHTALPAATCLVVDDGSLDDTAAIARRAGAAVIELPVNLGVGGAMRAGYRFALVNGYDVAVQIDADGQHDPSSVPAMVAQLVTADIVIGARFAGVGDYSVSGPRWWAMSFLSAVLSRAARRRLTDTTSGFKACGPRAIELLAREMPAEYLGDTIEALVIALKNGLIVDQYPVAMRPRAGGQPSHNPMKSAIYLVRGVFALAVAFIRPVGGARA